MIEKRKHLSLCFGSSEPLERLPSRLASPFLSRLILRREPPSEYSLERTGSLGGRWLLSEAEGSVCVKAETLLLLLLLSLLELELEPGLELAPSGTRSHLSGLCSVMLCFVSLRLAFAPLASPPTGRTCSPNVRLALTWPTRSSH